MNRAAIAAAFVIALGGTAMAIAQPGSGGPPEDPGAVAEEASAFGQCVSEASASGAENPAETCAELKPGSEGQEGQGNGEGRGAGSRDETPAAQCQGEDKEDGSFGRCVAEHASGQPGNGNGPPEGVPNGPPEGTPSGPPEGTPSGPPEGTPSGPPEGTPSGPPAGVPNGPPEGRPSGPPEGVPNGPPEGTPSGPPEGTPGRGPGA